VNGNPVGTALISQALPEGDAYMATKQSKAANTAPAADEEVARGADVPLALATTGATRDALVDPRDTDYVPDADSKGYHAGLVRQPAEPVLMGDGVVHFESIADQPSKFEVEDGKTDIDVLKEAHNARDAALDSDLADNTPTPTRAEALGLPDDGDSDVLDVGKMTKGKS
jgi:hypothetical protein